MFQQIWRLAVLFKMSELNEHGCKRMIIYLHLFFDRNELLSIFHRQMKNRQTKCPCENGLKGNNNVSYCLLQKDQLEAI